MKFNVGSFALGIVVDCLLDVAFITIGKHFFEKRTGGSFRELYEDNKADGDDNDDTH